ncbi:hypothetical protein BT93_E2695 [Corymbia citriodora subsp. variegata]|nr:hypothetical protein BT93_E2695 [Corymbia citriodora subsp. variegata]
MHIVVILYFALAHLIHMIKEAIIYGYFKKSLLEEMF